MKLTLKRFSMNDESTLGLLFVNGVFFCYTIEDIKRDIKVDGQTRIPAGTYHIKLRNAGGMNEKYNTQHSVINHRGMLHLQNVPGFTFVYIHIGNSAEDSHGCILVGNGVNNNSIEKVGFVSDSTKAYRSLYLLVAKAIETEYTYIEVIDEGV